MMTNTGGKMSMYLHKQTGKKNNADMALLNWMKNIFQQEWIPEVFQCQQVVAFLFFYFLHICRHFQGWHQIMEQDKGASRDAVLIHSIAVESNSDLYNCCRALVLRRRRGKKGSKLAPHSLCSHEFSRGKKAFLDQCILCHPTVESRGITPEPPPNTSP